MKFFRVEVSRKTYSALYLAVPDETTETEVFRMSGRQPLQEAADETIDSMDWDDDIDNQDVDVEKVEEVTEKEARDYSVWDIAAKGLLP